MEEIAIEQLRLKKENGYVVVEVCICHRWFPVIRETFDTYPIHTITAYGILDKFYRNNARLSP